VIPEINEFGSDTTHTHQSKDEKTPKKEKFTNQYRTKTDQSKYE